MSSLLDSLKEQITPDMIRGLTSSLGESGDSVQKDFWEARLRCWRRLRARPRSRAFSVKS